jgi:hypothetical protein
MLLRVCKVTTHWPVQSSSNEENNPENSLLKNDNPGVPNAIVSFDNEVPLHANLNINFR